MHNPINYQNPLEPHPDDLAVDRFAEAMKRKMALSRAKGRGGWEDPTLCTAEDLRRMTGEHFRKGDPIDVGNFAMMLWNRGESTAKSALTSEDQQYVNDALDRADAANYDGANEAPAAQATTHVAKAYTAAKRARPGSTTSWEQAEINAALDRADAEDAARYPGPSEALSKTPLVYMDQIDAGRRGQEWLETHAHRGVRIEYSDNSGPAIPRVQWGIVFDSYERIVAGYLLTRDAKNWTQLVLFEPSTVLQENGARYEL